MSQITVTNIQGQTSGGNANKVIITSGHTLEVTSNSTVGGSLTAPDIRATAIKSPTGNASTTIANDGKVTFNSSVEQSGSTLPQLGMIKVADLDFSDGVSDCDVTSTHINSTYDSYMVKFRFKPSNDNVSFRLLVFSGGTVQTGSIYAYEGDQSAGGAVLNNNADTKFRISSGNIGNATGEGISGQLTIYNVNDSFLPFAYQGFTNYFNTSAGHVGNHLAGSLIAANASTVVNGLRFTFSSGNFAGTGNVKVYGIR